MERGLRELFGVCVGVCAREYNFDACEALERVMKHVMEGNRVRLKKVDASVRGRPRRVKAETVCVDYGGSECEKNLCESAACVLESSAPEESLPALERMEAVFFEGKHYLRGSTNNLFDPFNPLPEIIGRWDVEEECVVGL
jgi:hypothetical protein|tara:strand:- start:157 stop:579 length:423 start_codon:yes stop_codon:yes gene_type:complete